MPLRINKVHKGKWISRMTKTTKEHKPIFVASKISKDLWERLDRYARAREWTTSQAIRSCITRTVTEDSKR